MRVYVIADDTKLDDIADDIADGNLIDRTLSTSKRIWEGRREGVIATSKG
jgi:hypothetical protein